MTLPKPRPLYLATIFAGIVAVVFAIGAWLALRLEREHMNHFVHEASVAESRWAFALLTQAVEPLLESGRARGAIDEDARRAIDDLVGGIAARSSIRKLKIFDAGGALIHANPALPGIPDHRNAALTEALSGRTAMELRAVTGFVGIDGRVVDGHVLGAYHPYHATSAAVAGVKPDLVVEIYVDVTDLVARADAEFGHHEASLLGGLAVLYLLIVGAVLWGARAVTRMERLQEQSAATAIRSQRQLREAKRRAEENESFLREAIGSMEYGFLLFDAGKRALFWNDRYLALLPPVEPVLRRGATLHELIAALAESPLYAIPLPERTRWTDQAVPRLWDGQPFRRRLTNGRTLRIALMPTRDGGRVLSLQDVTDDVAVEDNMARLALVAEHTDNAVVIAAADGAVEWANAGFTRITGHDLAEVIGRPLADVLDLTESDAAERVRIAESVAGGTSFDAELRSRTKAGVTYWLQLASTPVRDAMGRVTRHVAIASDVTTRKDQERRLAEALMRERELVAQQKRFVAIAAHELRTPLTIIDGAAQRLARNADRITPADLRERAGRIRAGVTRLAELVDTTLDSARLDEGRIELNPAKVDLCALVAGAVRRLTGMPNPMRIAVNATEPAVEIEGDARLLDQVFGNLLSNAIKYSGASRLIAIDIVGRADAVDVAVKDSGIGIPDAELSKLFERFYRASTAKGLPGTGIGLHLVRELVALHGGSVVVASKVGEGSVFTVTLPRRQPPRAASTVMAEPSAAE
jgi:PAS domain S-box-containing protein